MGGIFVVNHPECSQFANQSAHPMHSKAFPYSKPFRLKMKNTAFEFSLAHDIDIISRHVVPERAGGKSFKRKRKLSTKESIGRQNVREATNQ